MWGLVFLLGCCGLVAYFLSPASIILKKDEILVQSLWTRKIDSIKFKDIVEVNVYKNHYIELLSREKKIHIRGMALSKDNFEFLSKQLQSKT